MKDGKLEGDSQINIIEGTEVLGGKESLWKQKRKDSIQ